jgi:hypothetical protein
MSKRKAADDGNVSVSKVQKISNEFKFCDIKLIIQDNIINFRKANMYDSSNVFKTMLDDCPDIKTFTLDEDPLNMTIILDIMAYHDDMFDRINSENYFDIYMLLDKYDIMYCRNDIINKCVHEYSISECSICLICNFGSDRQVNTMCRHFIEQKFTFDGLNTHLIPQIFWLKCIEKIADNIDIIDEIQDGNDVEYMYNELKYIHEHLYIHVSNIDMRLKIKKQILDKFIKDVPLITLYNKTCKMFTTI